MKVDGLTAADSASMATGKGGMHPYPISRVVTGRQTAALAAGLWTRRAGQADDPSSFIKLHSRLQRGPWTDWTGGGAKVVHCPLSVIRLDLKRSPLS